MSGFVGFVLALELMVALMGLFLAVTPWLMKKQECFTVTIPEFAFNCSKCATLPSGSKSPKACVTPIFSAKNQKIRPFIAN